ncbi:hypothetical protein D6D28_00539 [Aureobasidium pullulans]|uniref:D-serine dehydratase-like domain-containing protein n=1 Tax=Aureobasidium pullulans TaxID=5580 RepID=A0A4V4I1N0_AURPU|nr:hypothetical protein D6D28_00539 [Aureobasidium pullulans]
MSSFSAPSFYPSPSRAALQLQYVGKNVKDVPAPAAVLDLAPIRRNCKAMLEATKALGLGFRAHVKTHKTIELAQYQMGHQSKDIRLIASTILYGLPVAVSHIPRLAAIAKVLDEGAVGLFVDHPEQIKHLAKLDESVWPGTIPLFIKIAAPISRAGLLPRSESISPLVQAIVSAPKVRLVGAYAHMGESYGSNSPEEALEFLMHELKDAEAGADQIAKALPNGSSGNLTISLGATPTATAVQNALVENEWNDKFRTYVQEVKKNYDVEIHAGVYPVLDMQQLATRARPTTADGKPLLSTENIALRIMVEVASTYDEREKPEALVAAGSIVLAREPCKSYPGWGVVTPWTGGSAPADTSTVYDPAGSKTGWIVGRISQEHGNLTWEGPTDDMRKLDIGEKVMIWPNHACMAGPNFGYYVVVDGESSEPDKVQDVWTRWRGW